MTRRLPYILWPWTQVARYRRGVSCLDHCSSGHTYGRWCLLRSTAHITTTITKATMLDGGGYRADEGIQRDPDGRIVGFVGYPAQSAPPGWQWQGDAVTGSWEMPMTEEERADLRRRFESNDARPSGLLMLDDPPRRPRRYRWWRRSQCAAQEPPAQGVVGYLCTRVRWHWGSEHVAMIDGIEVARWPRG